MKNPQCTDTESPKGDVLSMLKTTQIKLESKDCVFLANYLGYIQFTPQLYSTVSFPTSLGRLARPTVTIANCHQKKYEVNNPKVGSLSLTGELQRYLHCLINVANHTDWTITKGLYITRKLSRYSVYTFDWQSASLYILIPIVYVVVNT